MLLQPSHSRQWAATLLMQSRRASTTRRARKSLNIPPTAPAGGPASLTGTSGRSQTAFNQPSRTDSIVYNPPASAPNMYLTPWKFLPKDDMRIRFRFAAQGIGSVEGKEEAESSLPPPVRKPYQKQYHLGPEQIEEIRRLRKEDENKWTRTALAQRFQCSQLLVALVAPASEERKARQRAEEEKFLRTWRKRGVSSLKTRRERRRRKALWGVEG